jgi:hypothetical protein
VFNEWLRKRKIARLPGTRATPDVVLGQSLEMARAGELKSVYLGLEWKDGTFTGMWSNQCVSTLCVHSMMASRLTQQELFEGGNTYHGPSKPAA